MTKASEILESEKLWVSDNGDVLCYKHAGTYLKSAIDAEPKAISHRTPLGGWDLYAKHLLGGLPCSSCVDWSTLKLEA